MIYIHCSILAHVCGTGRMHCQTPLSALLQERSDSQPSLGSTFDLLLAEPDAVQCAPASPPAAIPKPMRLQASHAAPARRGGRGLPQQGQHETRASLFDTTQQDDTSDRIPSSTATPAVTEQPKMPPGPAAELPPAQRKRKVAVGIPDRMGPPASRRAAGMTVDAAMQRDSSCHDGAAPQHTPVSSLPQAARDGVQPVGNTAAPCSSINGIQGPMAAPAALHRTSSGSKRGSGGSQGSQTSGSPGKRVAAITLVEARFCVLANCHCIDRHSAAHLWYHPGELLACMESSGLRRGRHRTAARACASWMT